LIYSNQYQAPWGLIETRRDRYYYLYRVFLINNSRGERRNGLVVLTGKTASS
jgi:hypothetical protein